MRKESKFYKQEGYNKVWSRVNYDKDYSYIKDRVYRILNDPKSIELIIIETIGSTLTADPHITLETVMSRIPSYKNEVFAVRHFAGRWATENKEIMYERFADLMKITVDFILTHTDMFTNDYARCYPYVALIHDIMPQVLVPLYCDNTVYTYKRPWRKLESCILRMINTGNDISFKKINFEEMIEEVRSGRTE